MKRIILSIVAFIAVFTMMLFGGCGNSEKQEYKSLADLAVFKDKDLSTVTKVEVRWSDTGGPYFFKYNIEGEDLEHLMGWLMEDDAFVSHEGAYIGNNNLLTFYSGEEELDAIGFVNIEDGEDYYMISNELVYRFVEACGIRQDYLRGLVGLEYLTYDSKIDIENIVKIKAYIQQSDDWLAPNYAVYEITEAENVDYLVEKLMYRKAFLELNELWDSDDLSYIELFDNSGEDKKIYLNYGGYKLIDCDVIGFILDYGRTNGYL